MTEQQADVVTMPFGNILRGRLAERILVTLLERGGYRIVRLGVEELFDEVKYLPLKQYLELGLPKALRTLPDLLVSDPAVTSATLIEIKYRRKFDRPTARDLHRALTEQRKYWPESHAVLMIAEPFVEGGRFHQDYIRVIPPGETDRLLDDPLGAASSSERARMAQMWDRLPMITTVFKTWLFDQNNPANIKRGHEFWSGADYITAAIRELRKF